MTSSDTPLRLGFLGRLHQKKSLSLLIKAPPKGDTNISLTIVGIDPEEEALKTKANALGITDRINWLGFVRDKEAFFEQIDILVMPSEYECSGMAANEAIASYKTGIDEIIKTTGLVRLLSLQLIKLSLRLRNCWSSRVVGPPF